MAKAKRFQKIKLLVEFECSVPLGTDISSLYLRQAKYPEDGYEVVDGNRNDVTSAVEVGDTVSVTRMRRRKPKKASAAAS